MGDVDARREADAINALRHEFGPEEYGGWLSTLVWNVRNRYSAFPQNPIEAESVRLLVVGFLAEVAALVAERDEALREIEFEQEVASRLQAQSDEARRRLVAFREVVAFAADRMGLTFDVLLELASPAPAADTDGGA